MADPAVPHQGLGRVLARFPAQAQLIRELFLADRVFRSVCEDYRLAQDGLAAFERLSAAAPRPEVEDYRVLVQELEAEILGMFGARPDPTRRHAPRRPGE